MTTATRNMSVEEFQTYAATHGRCELIDGEVRHMSPAGSFHGIVIGRIGTRIGYFVLQHELGEVWGAETGFVLNPDARKAKVRAPDVAFIARRRAAAAKTPKFCAVPPDLCVEVLSPDDRVGDVNEKVKDWLTFGVRLVWVVDPDAQTVTVHDSTGRVSLFRANDTLTGGDVLPGFELRIQMLFD